MSAAGRMHVGAQDVHLWLARVRPGRTAGTRWLTAGERRRAARFARTPDREEYVLAHAALRRLLAVYTGGSPAGLALGREPCPACGGAHGRPVLRGDGAPQFSLAHSGGVVLVGVSGSRLGVDVQRAPSASTADACLHRLHPAEHDALRRLPPAGRASSFGRVWTRKEAYLKGVGTGLAHGAAADDLVDTCALASRGWTVRDVEVHPGFVAATAVRTDRPVRTSVRRYPEDLVRLDGATGRPGSARRSRREDDRHDRGTTRTR